MSPSCHFPSLAITSSPWPYVPHQIQCACNTSNIFIMRFSASTCCTTVFIIHNDDLLNLTPFLVLQTWYYLEQIFPRWLKCLQKYLDSILFTQLPDSHFGKNGESNFCPKSFSYLDKLHSDFCKIWTLLRRHMSNKPFVIIMRSIY